MNAIIRTIFFAAVSVLCCAVALPVTVHAGQTDGLVLWNRLGNPNQVLNSEVGPGFELREEAGDVLFVDGVFGGALATTGGTADLGPAGGYLVMNPDDFFPADKTRGTVEFWIQKRIARLIPYQTGVVTGFGRTRYATGYLGIQGGDWTEESPNKLNFHVYGHANLTDEEWQNVPVGQWVHYGFSWDGEGIDGGPDDMRLYKDGVLISTHQGRFSDVPRFCCVGYSCGESTCDTGGYVTRVLSNHEGRRHSGCAEYPSGYCPLAYLDNILVWDFAKTDFSDRFTEVPIAGACPCDGPRGTNEAWKNHGAYVSCVVRVAKNFRSKGLIGGDEHGAIVSAAAHSDCGR